MKIICREPIEHHQKHSLAILFLARIGLNTIIDVLFSLLFRNQPHYQLSLKMKELWFFIMIFSAQDCKSFIIDVREIWDIT